MESVLAVTELDSLIAELDTRMTEIVPAQGVPDSGGICSLVGCSDNDSYWHC